MNFIVITLLILVASGLLAIFFQHKPRLCTAIGASGVIVACGFGFIPAFKALLGFTLAVVSIPSTLPLGEFTLGLDPLSAFFLVPLLLLSCVCALYGSNYLLSYKTRTSLGPPEFFFNVFVAAMVLVVVAQGTLLFLMAWEVMTIASFLALSLEHHDVTVRRAGFIYLIAGHAGVACLFILFLLLERNAGGNSFELFRSMPILGGGTITLIFILALSSFGIKAGFLPFYIWLPEAHAAAPSHVSALMSGVLIKLGLYGLLRIFTFLSPTLFFGPVLAIIGIAGALLGISLALYQRDIKRVLAYSSIENIGIITLGLGLAYWGFSRGNISVAALCACGALLHLWNHTLMKGLLFLSAGSILHGTGTKDLEKLGGLNQRMPKTGTLMVLGAIAIAGLPPLNGFIGEWLIYLGLIGGNTVNVSTNIFALLCIGLLAMVGSLAVFCFVRLIGITLLGSARSSAAAKAHESSLGLLIPMALLALACLVAAFIPGRIVQLFSGVMLKLWGPSVAAQIAQISISLEQLGSINIAIFIVLAFVGLFLYWRTRLYPALPNETWGCGYAKPTARMQYTGRGFAELLTGRLFPAFLRPQITKSADAILLDSYQLQAEKAPCPAPSLAAKVFPATCSFATDNADPLTRGIFSPFFAFCANRLVHLRWLQQGRLHLYILYILLTVVIALLWMSLRGVLT